MYWTDTADGHHCTRHDYTFRRGEVCHRCITDPPPDPGGIEVDEEEVRALRARISELRAKARKIWRVADEQLDKETDRDVNAAAKLIAEHTKIERLAEELQTKLDEYVRDDRLVRRAERLAGVGASH